MALAVAPRDGCRVICYCGDCQAFARFLAHPGTTDAWGGTDIFQVAPASVRITAGEDTLRCMRLSETGMYRFYCGACKTPVGNSNGPRVPFIGLIHSFMDTGAIGRTLDDVLGKPVGDTGTKSAIGALPVREHGASSLKVMGRSVRLLAKWWLTGAGSPSAFFDARTRAPVSPLRILRPDERAAL